jgi:hypothetical protein
MLGGGTDGLNTGVRCCMPVEQDCKHAAPALTGSHLPAWLVDGIPDAGAAVYALTWLLWG